MLAYSVNSGTTFEEKTGKVEMAFRSCKVQRCDADHVSCGGRDEPRDFSANCLGSLGLLLVEHIESVESGEQTNWEHSRPRHD
jgi:hypothetical protein